MEDAYKDAYDFWATAKKNGRFTIKSPLDGTPQEHILPTEFPPHVQKKPSIYEVIYKELGDYRVMKAAPNPRRSDKGLPGFDFYNIKKKNYEAMFYVSGLLGKMPWEDAVRYAQKSGETRDGMGVQADTKYLSLLILADVYIAKQLKAALETLTTKEGHTVDSLLDVDGPFHRLGQARSPVNEKDVAKKRQYKQEIREGKKTPYIVLKVCTAAGKRPTVNKGDYIVEEGRIIADADDSGNAIQYLPNDLRFLDGIIGFGYWSGINYKEGSGNSIEIYQPNIQCDSMLWYSREEKGNTIGGLAVETRIVARSAPAAEQAAATQKQQPGPPAEPAAGQKRAAGDDEFHNDGITDADLEAAAEVEEAERLDRERREKMRRVD